jgi:hypothetical protein
MSCVLKKLVQAVFTFMLLSKIARFDHCLLLYPFNLVPRVSRSLQLVILATATRRDYGLYSGHRLSFCKEF